MPLFSLAGAHYRSLLNKLKLLRVPPHGKTCKQTFKLKISFNESVKVQVDVSIVVYIHREGGTDPCVFVCICIQVGE